MTSDEPRGQGDAPQSSMQEELAAMVGEHAERTPATPSRRPRRAPRLGGAPTEATTPTADPEITAALTEALDDALARRLPLLLDQSLTRRLPALLDESLTQRLPALLDESVAQLIPAHVEAAVVQSVDATVPPAMRAALDAAVRASDADREAEPDTPAAIPADQLLSAVEEVLPGLIDRAVAAALEEVARALPQPRTDDPEKIDWRWLLRKALPPPESAVAAPEGEAQDR